MRLNEIIDIDSDPYVMTISTKTVPFNVSILNRTWKLYRIIGNKAKYLGSIKDSRQAKNWIRLSTRKDTTDGVKYVASKFYLDDV